MRMDPQVRVLKSSYSRTNLPAYKSLGVFAQVSSNLSANM